ncbi:hypothetical protein SAMN05216525_1455 [Bradyrhizobium sp. Gha]|nr:hypothetical protein SAMN05216525_1455 [Bradyrhizobium sp. Gha]
MVILSSAVSLARPLWGRGRKGGSPGRVLSLWLPPSLPLPHKGGGNERVVPPSPAKSLNDSSSRPTVHGVVFELLSDGRHA